MTAIEHEEEFKEMELWEHLAELRTRLVRAAIYIVVGLVVAWSLYQVLYDILFAPITPILEQRGWKIQFLSFTDGFMLQLHVSLIAGLLVAIPLVTFELWGFIAPGLTRTERKACYVVFPLSVFFFFAGVACGYLLMGVAVNYFVQFIPQGVDLNQRPNEYLTFLVKMIVAFGLCFQMPVILMFLGWVGMITSRTLVEQWRLAVVACFVVAAVATPGGDPVTMMVMAAPLAVLYLASIFMVRFVERMRERQERKEMASGAYSAS